MLLAQLGRGGAYDVGYGISLSLSDVEDREADRPYRDVVVRLRQFHPHAGILTLRVLGFTPALTFTSDSSGLRSGLATRRTFARGAQAFVLITNRYELQPALDTLNDASLRTAVSIELNQFLKELDNLVVKNSRTNRCSHKMYLLVVHLFLCRCLASLPQVP